MLTARVPGRPRSEYPPPTAPDPSWTSVGHLRDARLNEVSGVVVGRTRPDVLWVHNDSGDVPRVFAIRRDGSLVDEVAFAGAAALDWEDIAIGPGPRSAGSAPWLYAADIGDNLHARASISVYRTPEPAPGVARVAAERIRLSYPDGVRRNAETMLVDPRTGDLVIVAKADGIAEVFTMTRTSLDAGGGMLHAAGSFAIEGRATGGDVSADGARVVVRTYDWAYAFDRRPDQTIADALAGTPRAVRAPASEAIAFTGDGASWLSIAEGAYAEVFTRAVPG